MVHERGIQLIHRWEGLRLRQYWDIAGVSTIGWGSIRLEDGSPVPVGLVITRERADALFYMELVPTETRVRSFFRGFPLDELQIAALVSFAYNLGMGALRGSTLAKRVKQGDWAGAEREFAKWHHAGGLDSRGLKARRQAEADLFFEGAMNQLYDKAA